MTGGSSEDTAICAEGLTKRVGWWKPQTLLDGLDLTVRRGEVFGLLGPNGAGKTTTFKLLLGLVRATAGRAWLFGREVPGRDSREGVGYLPEVVNHPDYLTVGEYLRYHARLRGLPRTAEAVDEALRRLGMEGMGGRLLGHCSKGMRQRVDLARVLMGDARLILLDEPVSGLDPLGQHLLKEVLQQLRRDGISILLSSHAVGMLADVCDTVGFLHRGKLVRQGRLAELLESGRTRIRFQAPPDPARLPQPPRPGVEVQPAAISLASPSSGAVDGRGEAPSSGGGGQGGLGSWMVSDPAAVGPCVAALVQAGAGIVEVRAERYSLEAVFTRVVGSAQEVEG